MIPRAGVAIVLLFACCSSSKNEAGTKGARGVQASDGPFDCAKLLTPEEVRATCGVSAILDKSTPTDGRVECAARMETGKGTDLFLKVNRGDPRMLRTLFDAWVKGAPSRGDTEVAEIARLGDTAYRSLEPDWQLHSAVRSRTIKSVSGGWMIELRAAGRDAFPCTFAQLEALSRMVLTRLPSRAR